MSDESTKAIRSILRSVLEDIDDPDACYRLRTALQLLDVRKNNLSEAIETGDDDGIEQRLRELGYVESSTHD